MSCGKRSISPDCRGNRGLSLLKVVFAGLVVCAFFQFVRAGQFSGRCVGVTDGDTISVMWDDRAFNVRLDGIDCPERGQDYANRAKEFTSKLVFGKPVTVKVLDLDRNRRLVARVFVDGKDVSLELVKAGLAWHYKRYSKDPVLAQAEVAARKAKVGLWTRPAPIAPWEWKNRNRSRSPKQPTGGSDPRGNRSSKGKSVFSPRTWLPLVTDASAANPPKEAFDQKGFWTGLTGFTGLRTNQIPGSQSCKS